MAGVKIDIDISMDADKVASEVDKVNKALDGLNTTSKKTNTTQESGADDVTKAIKKETEAIDEASRAQQKAAKEQEKTARAQKKAVEDQIKAVKVSVSTTADAAVSTTKSAFSSIRDIALGTLTALGLDELFGNVSDSLSTAISDASSIVESENLLRATFNQGADSMLNWADASATAYGLTNIEAKKYLSFITGVLNNTGVANDALEDMTTNYVRVVGDLASAFNTETSEAFEAIRSGIAGNTTAMQRYGVVLSVANLQQFLNEKGIAATYKTLDAASKQYVRYAYIMKSTADIQGDYTNTFDSFSNSVKTLKGEWQNFLALVGQYAIPLLQPVIQTLATMIAYARAVVEYLAELFGLEKYTSAAMDYSYLALENTEDTADAQNDVTEAVKATNKEMKKGVKLLDLYTLDFTDSSSKTGTTAKADTAAIADDLKSLTEGIEYNIPEFVLPEIKVDESKVKEIGDVIAGIIKGVEFFINGVKSWLDKPLPNKLIDIGGLVGGLFAWKTFKPALSKLPEKIGTWISTTWKAPLKGPILKIFTGLGSVALAGIGGWNLGSAIYNSIETGVVDIPGLISGTLLAAGGIIAAFASGAGFGIAALVVAPLAGALAYVYAAEKDANEAITNVMKGTRSLVDYINEQPAHESIQNFASDIGEISNKADVVRTSILNAIGEAENFDTAVTVLPSGQTAAEFMKDKYDTLTTAVTNYIDTVKTPVDSDLLDSLTGPNGLLEGADSLAKKLEESLSSIRELQKSDIAGYREELSKLAEKQVAGTITSAELERMAFIKEQLKLLGDVAGEVSTAKYDIDLTTLGASLDLVKSDVTEAYDSYTTVIDTYNSDIKYFANVIDNLDKTSDDYQTKLEQYTSALEGAKTGLDATTAQLKNNLTSISEAAQTGFEAAQKQFYSDTLPAAANYLLKAPDKNTWIAAYRNAWGDLSWKDVLDAPEDVTIRQFAKVELELTQEQLDKMTDEELEDLAFASREMQLLIQGNVSSEDMYYTTNKGNRYNTILGGIYADFRDSMLSNLGDVNNIYVDENTGEVRFKDLDVYVDLGIKPGDILTEEDKNTLVKKIEKLPEIVKSNTEKAGDTLGNNITEAVSKSTSSEESTEEIKNSVESGLTSALENVETPEEAKTKGTDLANAITGGMTEGFNTALSPGSDFMNAANSLTETLKGIPNAFASEFKSAINNISTYINTLVDNLKTQTSSLNLPEGDVTLSALYKTITTSNFKIPQLADGGVIPANNPFLAVLGDQRRGVNIEAPVTVIQDVVRDVVHEADTQTPVEVKVYIGDREIRDFVVDTITANNLIVG